MIIKANAKTKALIEIAFKRQLKNHKQTKNKGDK